MKYFITASALLLLATEATAFCSVPRAPYQGASDFEIQRYYRQLEDYQQCMQSQLRQQEQQRQQEQFQQQFDSNSPIDNLRRKNGLY